MALTSGVSLRGSFYTHPVGSPPRICAHRGMLYPCSTSCTSLLPCPAPQGSSQRLEESPGRHPHPVPTCVLTPGSSAPPLPSAPFPGSSISRLKETSSCVPHDVIKVGIVTFTSHVNLNFLWSLHTKINKFTLLDMTDRAEAKKGRVPPFLFFFVASSLQTSITSTLSMSPS